MQVSFRVRMTGFGSPPGGLVSERNLHLMSRVQNSLTGQVLEVGPGSLALVDDNHWISLTQMVRSGLDWPGTRVLNGRPRTGLD